MIEVGEKNIKEIYVVYTDQCPVWQGFKNLWEQLAAKYGSDSVAFYHVDVATDYGKEFAKSRFIGQSPTIISNEGFRMIWQPDYTEDMFKEKFLKQENVLGSMS